MKIKNKQQIITEETVDIVCNACGSSCMAKHDDPFSYEGLIEARFICGAYSKIGDGKIVEFSLCENCLISIFKKFRHSPYVMKKHE